MNATAILSVLGAVEALMVAMPGLVASFRATASPEDQALIEQELDRVRLLFERRSKGLDDAIERFEVREAERSD
ncbi:MAG: hypothetical protein KDH19_01330 [Geminicoccaceae bacterium]|nr:hypothetical protein [Geminicoccaceae bacterium]